MLALMALRRSLWKTSQKIRSAPGLALATTHAMLAHMKLASLTSLLMLAHKKMALAITRMMLAQLKMALLTPLLLGLGSSTNNLVTPTTCFAGQAMDRRRFQLIGDQLQRNLLAGPKPSTSQTVLDSRLDFSFFQ